ncbi:MAG: HAMP domain-containing histidine kinase [Lachnospiraceae bacterium]|nr:HAMP domain-containing histidine kinase [Lachnospiraceae bacterium]
MKKLKERFNLRVQFTIIIIIAMAVSIGGTYLVLFLLKRFLDYNLVISPILWILVIGITTGGTLSNYIGTKFLDPTNDLGKSMKKVAAGDFTVPLDTAALHPTVREIYENFNVMTAELRNTEVLKTDFVSSVSHEFKTPIGAIEGYAMLLQDSDSITPGQQECIDKILYNTKRLTGLIGNVLLLSKVDNQVIPSVKESFSLDEQLRQTIINSEPQWEPKNIDFDVDLQEINYVGNEDLLSHVWSNLLGNAIKFSPDGGTIKIRAVRDVGSITVTVEDEGSGIPADSISHIFDKFYQADTSRQHEGSGLGLSLVKRILELHNGTVSAENIESGGARFMVKL